ncbi:MAG: hypothetical protein KBA26_12745, partial [Candidatus Delongbacteria bacterium]|nr:hypothetical protein [Candidatus Delongbacteria bacterium]
AHTPNALEKAIQSLYKIGWKNVITIFGCGGDRDRTKRLIMGKIAAELSSKCIVTSDNPRTEDPNAIIADIMKGITTSRAITIPNRQEAIEMGIRLLIDDQTCLLIAGKGHENYQIIGRIMLHSDDCETAERALRQFRHHILILGYGITGKALLDFCRHHGFTATLYDAKPVTLLPEHLPVVTRIINDDTLDSLDYTQFDFIVFSPGVKLPSSLQEEWIHNDRMINEIDFGYLFSSGTIHAVTGTNGKTTTTSLLAHGLQQAGIRAVAAGNIGYPFISAVDSDAEAYSLELSSYQIETLKYLLYDSLIFINLAPDHLDHYPSLEDYYQAKRKILHHAHAGSITIDGVTLDLCREAKAVSGAYDDIFTEQKERFINPENTSAVVLLWEKFHYLPQALAGFFPPPHRMELIRELHGIKIYNDSKSTNLHSLTNALSLFPDHGDLLLLISGKDKNEDYAPILPLIRQKVRRIYTSGGANHRFAPALENENLEVVRSDRLFESLDKAYHQAEPGSVILLSPGLPSFDEFKNFEDRGDQFRQKVSQLI